MWEEGDIQSTDKQRCKTILNLDTAPCLHINIKYATVCILADIINIILQTLIFILLSRPAAFTSESPAKEEPFHTLSAGSGAYHTDGWMDG